MPNWNTEKIISELTKKISNIEKIRNMGQGGDYDTDNLSVKIKGSKDVLYLCGFTPKVRCTTPENAEVEIIQITDGLDSRGGLNSNNENLAVAFVQIRKFFEKKGFSTANTIKEYF
jgi:hypothetical protein